MKHVFSKQNRALLSELVRTDFKLRYQGSILGYAWSLLRPLLLFLILYIVFVKFLRLGGSVPHFPIYLLLGIVLWNFFAEMTSQSLGSIVGRGDLIRKVKIPKWAIIISVSISALINLTLNLIVVSAFLFLNKVELSSSAVLLPLIIVEIYVFALAISLWLSATYVKYRDVSYIWEVAMQGLFYFTPIIYALSLVPSTNLRKLIMLNPIAQAIQDARFLVVTKETLTMESVFGGWVYYLIPVVIISVFLVFGVIYFKNQSKYFAENI